MIYEEKLDLVIKAIVEARKPTRKGQDTKLYLVSDNGLKPLNPNEIYDILLKFQDDEKILFIQEIPSAVKKLFETDFESKDYFLLEIKEIFSSWHESYLMGQKTSLENLNYINMLRIYDVVLDINEQIQLTHKTTVYIHLIPSIIRFRALFPADTIGLRDEYCENRLGSLKYLKEKGVIDDYTHGQDGWDTIVTVSFVLSKFDDFYKTIMAEYVKQNKSDDTNTQTKIDKSQNPKAITKLNYDPQKGVLDIDGKTVKLNKDSFRAKLLELLLKDNESIKKEWSWDEVIEEIEGVKNEDSLKENKKKFYPACDGLSKFISQKIGINDLLFYNKSTVQINPKYL